MINSKFFFKSIRANVFSMKIKMISREYNSLKIVLNYFARENFATYKAVLHKNKVMRKHNLHC